MMSFGRSGGRLMQLATRQEGEASRQCPDDDPERGRPCARTTRARRVTTAERRISTRCRSKGYTESQGDRRRMRVRSFARGGRGTDEPTDSARVGRLVPSDRPGINGNAQRRFAGSGSDNAPRSSARPAPRHGPYRALTSTAYAAMFAPVFRSQVPLEQFNAISEQALGPSVRLERVCRIVDERSGRDRLGKVREDHRPIMNPN